MSYCSYRLLSISFFIHWFLVVVLFQKWLFFLWFPTSVQSWRTQPAQNTVSRENHFSYITIECSYFLVSGDGESYMPVGEKSLPEHSVTWFYWSLWMAFCAPELFTFMRCIRIGLFKFVPGPDIFTFAVVSTIFLQFRRRIILVSPICSYLWGISERIIWNIPTIGELRI